MILKKNETCPFSHKCAYHKPWTSLTICQGTNNERNFEFDCSYIDKKGKFVKEGITRNSNDVTGRMKLLID